MAGGLRTRTQPGANVSLRSVSSDTLRSCRSYCYDTAFGGSTMDITTAHLIEDAMMRLSDARLAWDPLTRLDSLIRANHTLADALSQSVADIMTVEATAHCDDARVTTPPSSVGFSLATHTRSVVRTRSGPSTVPSRPRPTKGLARQELGRPRGPGVSCSAAHEPLRALLVVAQPGGPRASAHLSLTVHAASRAGVSPLGGRRSARSPPLVSGSPAQSAGGTSLHAAGAPSRHASLCRYR